MSTSYNTIILKHGEGRYTKKQFVDYKEGNCIYGNNSDPEELKRWNGAQFNEAKQELTKYKCSYSNGSELIYVDEYAL